MRLALQVDSDNELADDPTLCIVDLTPELANTMLKRIAVLKQIATSDRSIYECYYMEYGSERYMNFDDPARTEGARWNEFADRLARGESFVVLPDNFRLPTDVDARIECPQMCVRQDCVQFTAIPKHCDWYIRTREIPLETIEKVAGEKGVPAATPQLSAS